MINNFRATFGSPEDVLILMGDYDRQSGFRNVEPTICKRFRILFKRAWYEIYLINEFRTSMLCNGCHETMDKFHYKLSISERVLLVFWKVELMMAYLFLICH